MKIKDECVFSALEGRSRGMVVAERHDKWRVFHETARSSGRGACSPQRHRQCPGVECPDGQRQGATAAARRDEGVTLRPRLLWGGVGLMPAPYLLTCPFGLPIRRHRQRSWARFVAVSGSLPDVRHSLAVGRRPGRPRAAATARRAPRRSGASLGLTHRFCRSIALSTGFKLPQYLRSVSHKCRN